ncbi:regulatory protein, luxR family [Actinacidiphila yanglinensis]|uniref:Regulatory protein, luxR family n=1 Tax=Actinacidiphila yanglinensis TaxID=310779 RepID=A0A1H6DG99_9ACTN|nr:regulatory protein, luxR family [Actinacidiphila yanglinensis]
MRIVARGDSLLSPGVTRRLIADIAAKLRTDSRTTDYRIDRLTDREREVLALVGRGHSNDEIAAKLLLSPLTVKTHVSRAMTKLAARDRAQLLVIAYETGLVTVGESPTPGQH